MNESATAGIAILIWYVCIGMIVFAVSYLWYVFIHIYRDRYRPFDKLGDLMAMAFCAIFWVVAVPMFALIRFAGWMEEQ